MNGLTDEERERVARHVRTMKCTHCRDGADRRDVLGASGSPWEVLGGEHFGYQSNFRKTVSVVCNSCGFIAFFLLDHCK